MSMKRKLVNKAGTVLRAIGAASHDLNDRRPGKGKRLRTDCAYEAYVYAVLIEVLASLKTKVAKIVPELRGGRFAFRRAPGVLSSTRDKFSYVSFTYKGEPYELHVDTKVRTKAPRALLEMDVLIVEGKEAMLCRKTGRHPRYRRMPLMLEVKYLSGKFGTVLAKAFLGIWNEISRAGKRQYCAVVTNTRSTENAGYLLAHRRLPCHEAVIPVNGKSATGATTGFRSTLRKGVSKCLT